MTKDELKSLARFAAGFAVLICLFVLITHGLQIPRWVPVTMFALNVIILLWHLTKWAIGKFRTSSVYMLIQNRASDRAE